MAEPGGRWRRGVICQICPCSVRESDGDGAGDLRGTAAKLRHLFALGVDARSGFHLSGPRR